MHPWGWVSNIVRDWIWLGTEYTGLRSKSITRSYPGLHLAFNQSPQFQNNFKITSIRHDDNPWICTTCEMLTTPLTFLLRCLILSVVHVYKVPAIHIHTFSFASPWQLQEFAVKTWRKSAFGHKDAWGLDFNQLTLGPSEPSGSSFDESVCWFGHWTLTQLPLLGASCLDE